MSGSAVDLDAGTEVFGEVGCVEDLILDGLRAVNSERVGDFSLSSFLLDGFSLALLDNWFSGFCGH